MAKLSEEEIEQEVLDEMEGQEEDNSAEAEENRMLANQEWMEGYGSPEPEEKQNQHSFLHKSAFHIGDTTRTTFLHEGELGRGLFTVRFMLDMEDIAKFYLDSLVDDFNKEEKTPVVSNKISEYFQEKRENVTGSGMSNKGFAQNMNVSRRIDTTRRRVRELPEQPLKGGKPQ